MTQVRKRTPLTPKQALSCCGPIDDLLDPLLFRALSDPTRLRILGCLIKCARACSIGEVAECCNVDFSVVSRHLRILENAGVLSMAKLGRTVTCCIDHAALAGLLHALAIAIESHAAPIDRAATSTACCSPRSSPSTPHPLLARAASPTHASPRSR